MSKKISKKILSSFALCGLLGCAICVQPASVSAQELELSLGGGNSSSLPSIEINMDAAYRAKENADALVSAEQQSARNEMGRQIIERELETLSVEKPAELKIDQFTTSEQPENESAASNAVVEEQIYSAENESKIPLSMRKKFAASESSIQSSGALAEKEDKSPAQQANMSESMTAEQIRKAEALERAQKLAAEIKANEKKRKQAIAEAEARAKEIAAKVAAEEKAAEIAEAARIEEEQRQKAELEASKDMNAAANSVDSALSPSVATNDNVQSDTQSGIAENAIAELKVIDTAPQAEPEIQVIDEKDLSVSDKIKSMISKSQQADNSSDQPVELSDSMAVKNSQNLPQDSVQGSPSSSDDMVTAVVELPEAPRSNTDTLNVASMFENRQDAPAPLSMQKKFADGSESAAANDKENIGVTGADIVSQAAVEATEDGSLLPPKSILPDALNVSPSASGAKPESMATAEENKSENIKEVEIASLPTEKQESAPVLDGHSVTSVAYDVDATDLNASEKSHLDKVIIELKSNSSKRINIIGYASNPDDTLSTARRVSLKRALSVREYFVGNGIDATRINVQAMGNEVKDGANKDRVDVIFLGNS